MPEKKEQQLESVESVR